MEIRNWVNILQHVLYIISPKQCLVKLMALCKLLTLNLIFVVPCIMLYSGEISPTRRNNCVFYSQWLYSTCFG